MASTVVHAQTLVVDGWTTLSPGWLVIDSSGHVVEVSGAEIEPEDGQQLVTAQVVVPGFVDIHNHGVGGTDNVTTYWSNPEYTLRECGRQGTTSMMVRVHLLRSLRCRLLCVCAGCQVLC